MHTGSIVDFYDDPQGSVLKSRLPQGQVPDFIKQAEFLTDEIRGKLPDDVFALVMIDQGDRMRKYACTDKGNTALSVIYFMQNRDRLPEEAQKVAAANLVTACEWYDLVPPLELLKTSGVLSFLAKNPGKTLNSAMVGSTVAAKGSEGMARHNVAMGKMSDVTGSEIMPMSSNVKTAGFARNVKDAWNGLRAEVAPVTLRGRIRGSLNLLGARGRAAGLTTADRVGGVAALLGPPLAGAGAAAGGAYGAYRLGKRKGAKDAEKAKSASINPYVDVTGMSPPLKIKQASARRYCMVKEGQAKFPIDSYGQVQQAAEYFEKHARSMHPADRRMYCTNLTGRADELGIEVSYNIRKYGSAGYAPDGEVNVAVCTRMQHWAEDAPERDMLKNLMEKAASVHPDVFCAALQQFDEATGMDHLWDEAIYDPFYSTYGFVKQAEWKWEDGNDRLTEDQLNLSAKKDFDSVKRAFGGELAQEFRKDPQQIFDSLPLDSKRIIARMANDPQ